MLTVGLDTSAYSAFKRGDESLAELLDHAPDILVPVIVVGELIAGFEGGSRAARNRNELARFLAAPGIRVAECGLATADRYASIHAALRKRGRPIPSNDLWIAALCLEHGAALVTLDAHFEAIGGLRLGRRLDDFLP